MPSGRLPVQRMLVPAGSRPGAVPGSPECTTIGALRTCRWGLERMGAVPSLLVGVHGRLAEAELGQLGLEVLALQVLLEVGGHEDTAPPARGPGGGPPPPAPAPAPV